MVPDTETDPTPLTDTQIARVCHEANRAYCEALGDTSQVAWEEAPEWQTKSALVGVAKAKEGKSPEQLHQSWMHDKLADGWVYGEVKDAEKKTHPCLVPYENLSPKQRRKDALFSGIVHALTT